MLVKLVQDQAHAVHEAIHIVWISVPATAAFATSTPMSREGFLEGFKVFHPFYCEFVLLDVGFVENEDERELRLV